MVRVLPSTSIGQLLLIDSSGCPNDWNNLMFSGDLSCSESRGSVYLPESNFQQILDDPSTPSVKINLAQSNTFKNYGVNSLETNFNLDNFSFGDDPSNVTTVTQLAVGKTAAQFVSWVGMLGLDYHPTNLIDLNETLSENSTLRDNQQPVNSSRVLREESLLQKLKNAGNISSLSWAYHAGSYGCMCSI